MAARQIDPQGLEAAAQVGHTGGLAHQAAGGIEYEYPAGNTQVQRKLPNGVRTVWTYLPSGVLASCASSYGTGLNRYTAHCTKGWAELDPALSYHGNKFAVARGRGVERPPIPDIFQFAAEMDAFCESILKNEPSRAPGEEGLKDLIAIEAIYKAAESGQAVKIDAAAT